jgi:hypothetical protein
MDWRLLIESGVLATVLYIAFKAGGFAQRFLNIENKIYDLDKKIDKNFGDVNGEVKEIKEILHSIDIRLVVLEAENVFYNAVPDVNVRSEAAKEMWRRRKQKQISVKKEGE